MHRRGKRGLHPLEASRTGCVRAAAGSHVGREHKFWQPVAPSLLPACTQDCSVEASPISDPSCAEPGNKLDNSYTYADLTMRAYYQTTKTIRSLLPSAADAAGSSAYLMSLDPNGTANQLTMRLFAATSKPADASGATVLCNNTVTVAGGSVAAIGPAVNATACAAGSYYDAPTMCPPWCALTLLSPQHCLMAPLPPRTLP